MKAALTLTSIRLKDGTLTLKMPSGFAKVQFDIMAMTGYPEGNFPIADNSRVYGDKRVSRDL